jgi:hypothetical protein
MQLRLVMAHRCSMCGELVFEDNKETVMTALFGAVFYAVCLQCFMPTDNRSVDYRRKWLDRAINQFWARSGLHEFLDGSGYKGP